MVFPLEILQGSGDASPRGDASQRVPAASLGDRPGGVRGRPGGAASKRGVAEKGLQGGSG